MDLLSTMEQQRRRYAIGTPIGATAQCTVFGMMRVQTYRSFVFRSIIPSPALGDGRCPRRAQMRYAASFPEAAAVAGQQPCPSRHDVVSADEWSLAPPPKDDRGYCGRHLGEGRSQINLWTWDVNRVEVGALA